MNIRTKCLKLQDRRATFIKDFRTGHAERQKTPVAAEKALQRLIPGSTGAIQRQAILWTSTAHYRAGQNAQVCRR